mmetsp:Transcript_25303/g.33858  ORF Transcript_25303/g.33858 Transcript_25303/m.33858 type:complete len:200 (+) Transcript_25303:839-1438(+)
MFTGRRWALRFAEALGVPGRDTDKVLGTSGKVLDGEAERRASRQEVKVLDTGCRLVEDTGGVSVNAVGRDLVTTVIKWRREAGAKRTAAGNNQADTGRASGLSLRLGELTAIRECRKTEANTVVRGDTSVVWETLRETRDGLLAKAVEAGGQLSRLQLLEANGTGTSGTFKTQRICVWVQGEREVTTIVEEGDGPGVAN